MNKVKSKKCGFSLSHCIKKKSCFYQFWGFPGFQEFAFSLLHSIFLWKNYSKNIFQIIASSHCFIGSQIPWEPALPGFALTFQSPGPHLGNQSPSQDEEQAVRAVALSFPEMLANQSVVSSEPWLCTSPSPISWLVPFGCLDSAPAYALWQVELTSLSSQGLPCLEGQWHPATQSGRGGQSYADLTLLLNSYASAVWRFNDSSYVGLGEQNRAYLPGLWEGQMKWCL